MPHRRTVAKHAADLLLEPTRAADVAVIGMFAQVCGVSPRRIQAWRTQQVGRQERILPSEALTMLHRFDLNAVLYQGDLTDLLLDRRPALVPTKSGAYLLVLLIEARLVLGRAGSALQSVTLKRSEFVDLWNQNWFAAGPRVDAWTGL